MKKKLPRHIFLQNNFSAYIDVPKAGCTGIREYLASELSITVSSSVHNINEFPLASSLQLLNESFRFTFVRHPVSRLFSCYKEKIRDLKFNHPSYTDGVSNAIKRFGFYSGMSFSEFLDICADTPDHLADNHFKSMHQILTHNNSIELPHFIGKIENFNDDFIKIKNILKFSTEYDGVSNKNSFSGKDGIIKASHAKFKKSDITKIKMRYAIDYEIFDYNNNKYLEEQNR